MSTLALLMGEGILAHALHIRITANRTLELSVGAGNYGIAQLSFVSRIQMLVANITLAIFSLIGHNPAKNSEPLALTTHT